jgi:hypothetical protein
MCDINNFIKDANHPFFIQRASVWETTKRIEPVVNSNTANTASLSSDEAACYANYMLTNKRIQLDQSLEEINTPYESTTYTYDSNYQTTMLTGLVWAALGTTVLYYAFTKI